MNEEHAEKVLFTIDDKFKFSCHRGLACYNTCCCDVNIFLTPYDVLRMRRSTGLSSEEFLKRYTIALLGEDGLPLVVLKMMKDENKTCHFVTPDGCSIYRDRPWSCRMYPVFPVSAREEEFLIEQKSSCLGVREEKQWTPREWKKDQDIDIYDKMNEAYKEITLHDYFKKGNKLGDMKGEMSGKVQQEKSTSQDPLKGKTEAPPDTSAPWSRSTRPSGRPAYGRSYGNEGYSKIDRGRA